ncbi:MAG: hypothetical protein ACE14L_09975 [Terriglobales bacterium]
MRVLLAIVTAVCMTAAGVWAQAPPAESAPCRAKNPAECGISKQDLKTARGAFKRGTKLRDKDPEQAYELFSQAVNLVPRHAEYLTAREVLKHQLVSAYMRRGNDFLANRQTIEAAAQFRHALELDPSNHLAAERLRTTLDVPAPPQLSFVEPALEDEEVSVRPTPGRQNFHFSSDARTAYTNVARAFGIKATFDNSAPSRTVRLDVDKATFYEAMDALGALTRTYWLPVSSNEVLVAADTPATHKELDPWVLRTFYLSETTTPQELNEVVNMFRTLFELRFVTPQPATSSITVRGPAPVVAAATRLLESLWAGRPQVMLDFEAIEVNSSMMRALGLDLPLQFNVFNITAEALAGLGNQNIQDLINQLIASGGINQANTEAISALLAQLQNQASQSSIFSQPVATFGGGDTLMGIGIPPASFRFSLNESRAVTLEKLTMRAAQGNAATFRLGARYPILNASFAPVFNTPQIASVIGSQSFVAPFPSFTYEDLGLTLKAKPLIHGNTDVTLDLEMELKALTGTAINGVPVLSNRSYKGAITVRNGEPAVLAGSLTRSETATLQGLPGISHIPGLNYLLSRRNKEVHVGELLILITPHIISAAPTGSTGMIVLPKTD